MNLEQVHRTKLLFASSNAHKLDEIRFLLPHNYTLLGLADIQWATDIPEPFDTFEENAKAKASLLFQHTDIACFADDSGLMVDALEGRPGVWSARYAGEHKNSQDNLQKVLDELGENQNRNAKFISVIAYQFTPEEIFLFRGEVTGTIHTQPEGQGGFGYDPIFIPAGFDQTFGHLSPAIKNLISHRANAMRKFVGFLRNH
jgi:XTP/dITP diphosphohydrolase